MNHPFNHVLVTGAAGFIGFHLSRRLLENGCRVTGLDNLNDYYDVSLKQARLDRLTACAGFQHARIDLADRDAVAALFREEAFDVVVNLAAQAGVRYSLTNPHAYVDANLSGFVSVLEGCRHSGVGHLVFASSSSVYGANEKLPFSTEDNVDHPVSLYAASKKANELMAHSYSHLFGLPTTGLRFFTVYGPWGRPDMAYFLFARAIIEGKSIDLFNNGRHTRDFTYIDDIVDGVVRVLDKPATPEPGWSGKTPDPSRSKAPWRIYNIGSKQSVELAYFVETLEQALGKKAIKNLVPLQPGDVPDTFADIEPLAAEFGYAPKTTIEEGINRFVTWYRDYHSL